MPKRLTRQLTREAAAQFPPWAPRETLSFDVFVAWPLNHALVWRTEMENNLVRALAATVRDLGPLTL
jgi:hypothetical protein